MAFLEDPRMRRRWNQISHNAEAVTENAAAGIWNLQQKYVGPCLASICGSIDSCAGLCLGDREERARRQRERERGARRGRAEYSFDFYDDWDDDDAALADSLGGGRGLLGSWGGGRTEDWDKLLAGTGSSRSRHTAAGADVADQPRRKRGMSYGTRGPRRTPNEQEDPTIIPSTAPLGFLGRLPFKIGGTLRYKPSAANLQDHPGGPLYAADEHEPLLGSDDEDEHDYHRAAAAVQTRKRSGTAGSGDTSSSYRSRGDLFPSDGEGDEDAIPLDDEFAVALDRVDDRSSGKTRISKGKRRADSKTVSRTASRTTIASQQSGPSLKKRLSSLSLEEERAEREEAKEIGRKRKQAAKLALARGLHRGGSPTDLIHEVKAEVVYIDDADEIHEPSVPEEGHITDEEEDQELPTTGPGDDNPTPQQHTGPETIVPEPNPQRQRAQQAQPDFIPARLPHFG